MVNQSPVEPTRGSVMVLAARLTMLYLGTDLLYVFINFFLMKVYFLDLPLPADLHQYIILLLAILHIGKSILQVTGMLAIILRWVSKTYTITHGHLIKRDGIGTIIAQTYDLENIRSVTVHQSILGKMLGFGDVVVETSASGGYQESVTLSGVDNPDKFERSIREYF